MVGGGGGGCAYIESEVSDLKSDPARYEVSIAGKQEEEAGVGGGVLWVVLDTPTSSTSNRMSEQLLCRWIWSPGATTKLLWTGKRACSQEMSHRGEVEMDTSSSRWRSNHVAMASTCPDDVTANTTLLSGSGI